MTIVRIDARGIGRAERALRLFGLSTKNLTPFWLQLGERLADEALARWPLKRRSGRLRESLSWAGDRLGGGGIFRSSPDRLTFGTSIFYGRFAQTGTKRQRATPLIHIDPEQHTEQLSVWFRERARRSDLEVTE